VNVFITGIAGFIGSHIAERVLFSGENKVMGIDNLATGRADNVPRDPYCQFNKADIAILPDLRDMMKGFEPDVVVHCAASYKDPSNWVEDTRTNCVGTANLATVCNELDVKRIIYFQTSLCYGLKPLEQPITLKHPIRPEGSSYAITKTFAEQILSLCNKPVITFRLANCYGPRNLSGPVPTFYKKITAGDKCKIAQTRRDFVFVDDLVDVVMKAMFQPAVVIQPYHVSSGSDVSIGELFEKEAEIIRKDAMSETLPKNPDDVETILLDPTWTERDFDWKASTPLNIGLKKAIEWYKTHDFGETFTHLKRAK